VEKGATRVTNRYRHRDGRLEGAGSASQYRSCVDARPVRLPARSPRARSVASACSASSRTCN